MRSFVWVSFNIYRKVNKDYKEKAYGVIRIYDSTGIKGN